MKKTILSISALLICALSLGQGGMKYSTQGNALSPNDSALLGTTNNYAGPLKFITQGIWRMAILSSGDIQVAKLQTGHTGIVTYTANGALTPLDFSGTASEVLSGAGTWVSGSSFSQWLTNGNNIYYSGGNVGIGLSNPTYPLTVQGSALINGNLFATNIAASNTLSVGTFKIVDGPTDSIVSVSPILNLASDSVTTSNSLSAGTKGINPITISSGQINSVLGNISFSNNNLTTTGAVNAGTINTPALNVADSIKSPLIVTSHIQVMPGDTAFFIGDAPQYWFSLPPSVYAGDIAGYFGTFSTGIGLGNQFTSSAFESNAVGTGLTVSSKLSVGIGFAFTNNIDHTIMLGWQKPILTVVGSGNGKVGIGLTNPTTKLEVNGNITVDADQTNTWTNAHWKTPVIIDNGSAIRTAAPGGFIHKYLGFGMTDDEGAAGWYWMVESHTDNSDNTCYPMQLTLDQNGYPTLTLANHGWCDYVFAKDYKRMSVEKKKEFYEKHEHLPGIDPENIVDNDGLNIGKNMKGIVKNVEENRLDITSLYELIEKQQKQIENLIKENAALKLKVNKNK